ncbi:hypothetical protein PPN86_12410 [Proteus mirabilis]|nr:hypothetical protein [Proteus mirabilis]MBI6340813.1 hypothetical protein [Proteus mirabilis]MDC6036842.1 hypothetical protein [Proteus mirabilis]
MTHTKLDSMGFPHFSDFPVNSCQGSSILLGLEASQNFSTSKVEIVLGSTRKRDVHHYWVEIDNKVYDLTIDQFSSSIDKKYQCPTNPVYAAKKHPLRNYFFYKERYTPIAAFSNFCYGYANLKDVISALSLVKKELERYGWE